MYCAEAPVCAESVPKLAAAGKARGIPVVYNTKISTTAPNFTAQCVAARQQGVTALYIGSSSQIVRVAADCSRQGYEPIYVAQGVGFGMNMASAPGLKKNLWMQFSGLPFFADTPQVKEFNAALDKHYPSVRSDNATFTQNTFMGWISAKLLERAIQAGGVTPADGDKAPGKVVKGLESLKNYTVNGMAPPLTFTPGKPHNVDCWYTARIRNGTPEVMNNSKVTCAP